MKSLSVLSRASSKCNHSEPSKREAGGDLTTETQEKKVMWWRRETFEDAKLLDAGGRNTVLAVGMTKEMDYPPRTSRGSTTIPTPWLWPSETVPGFWPQELQKNKYVLFKATKFLVVCNSISKKLIQCEPRTIGNIFTGDAIYKDSGGVKLCSTGFRLTGPRIFRVSPTPSVYQRTESICSGSRWNQINILTLPKMVQSSVYCLTSLGLKLLSIKGSQ